MDNFVSFLQKLQAVQPLQPIDAFNGPPPAMGEGDMLADDGFSGSNPKNISSQIQEALGAKEPDDGGIIGNILASRSRPTQDDATDALLKTMFSKSYTSPQDVASSRDLGVTKQLYALASINKLASGQNLPAAIQIANEYDKARKAGDTQRMNDIEMSGKLLDKGVVIDANGNASPLSGYSNAVGDIQYGKEGGKKRADIEAAGPEGFNSERGKQAGKLSVENDTNLTSLDMLDSSILQAKNLVPKVALTGPIYGRVGRAINDPDYANLQGALNGIVLQAKELYNLGSGQGFSDADRDFLQDVIAGKYSRAGTINLALDRMGEISQKRRQFIQRQSGGYRTEFQGAPPVNTAAPPAQEKVTDYKEYFK